MNFESSVQIISSFKYSIAVGIALDHIIAMVELPWCWSKREFATRRARIGVCGFQHVIVAVTQPARVGKAVTIGIFTLGAAFSNAGVRGEA